MRPRAHWFLFTLLLTVLQAIPSCGGTLNENELQCEEAGAHLARCCPDFPLEALDCHLNIGVCNSYYPMLSIEDSRCIVASSCDHLRATGVCERSQTRTTQIYGRSTVCQ